LLSAALFYYNPAYESKEVPDMRRFFAVLAIGILVTISAQDLSKAQVAGNAKPKAPSIQYEVLSPWADVDPIPLRGISPRLDSLSGKKIGIWANFKRAAMPMAESIEKRLKIMYPGIQTTIFHSSQPNVNEIETPNREKFTAWVKGLDAAIAVVGD
jgi:hypothetical protein